MSIKIGDSLGGRKVADREFRQAKSNLDTLAEALAAFHQRTVYWLGQLRSLQTSTHKLSSEFRKYYDKYAGRVTPQASKYEVLQVGQKDKIELLEKRIREVILDKITAWQSTFHRLQARIRDREESRVRFDHYYGKIHSLRNDKEKAERRGRPVPGKDAERLQRNEEKFSSAEKEYEKINAAVTKELMVEWEGRHHFIDPMFNEIVSLEGFFFTAYGKAIMGIAGETKTAMQQELPPPPEVDKIQLSNEPDEEDMPFGIPVEQYPTNPHDGGDPKSKSRSVPPPPRGGRGVGDTDTSAPPSASSRPSRDNVRERGRGTDDAEAPAGPSAPQRPSRESVRESINSQSVRTMSKRNVSRSARDDAPPTRTPEASSSEDEREPQAEQPAEDEEEAPQPKSKSRPRPRAQQAEQEAPPKAAARAAKPAVDLLNFDFDAAPAAPASAPQRSAQNFDQPPPQSKARSRQQAPPPARNPEFDAFSAGSAIEEQIIQSPQGGHPGFAASTDDNSHSKPSRQKAGPTSKSRAQRHPPIPEAFGQDDEAAAFGDPTDPFAASNNNNSFPAEAPADPFHGESMQLPRNARAQNPRPSPTRSVASQRSTMPAVDFFADVAESGPMPVTNPPARTATGVSSASARSSAAPPIMSFDDDPFTTEAPRAQPSRPVPNPFDMLDSMNDAGYGAPNVGYAPPQQDNVPSYAPPQQKRQPQPLPQYVPPSQVPQQPQQQRPAYSDPFADMPLRESPLPQSQPQSKYDAFASSPQPSPQHVTSKPTLPQQPPQRRADPFGDDMFGSVPAQPSPATAVPSASQTSYAPPTSSFSSDPFASVEVQEQPQTRPPAQRSQQADIFGDNSAPQSSPDNDVFGNASANFSAQGSDVPDAFQEPKKPAVVPPPKPPKKTAPPAQPPVALPPDPSLYPAVNYDNSGGGGGADDDWADFR